MKSSILPGQRLTPKTGRPSKALKGLAVHHCLFTGCGKTYTRKEHLLRHERTHRNELPYVCSECKQGYARQDLLKRHSSLKHGHSQPTVAESSRSLHNRTSSNTGDSVINAPQSLIDPHGYKGNEYAQYGQQGHGKLILPKATGLPTPTRSSTNNDLAIFSQMQISPSDTRYSSTITNPQMVSSARQLPIPWGASSVLPKQEDIDTGLLRAAAYGDLAEIRRLHLRGINVLATGNFHSGRPKSALFAAAEAIKACYDDIQRSPSGRERLYKEISDKAEVIRYLMFHGATLESLGANLASIVQRALEGFPQLATMEEKHQQRPGFRPLAAASPDVKLPPINNKTPGKQQEGPLDTTPLGRLRAEPDSLMTYQGINKGKGRT